MKFEQFQKLVKAQFENWTEAYDSYFYRDSTVEDGFLFDCPELSSFRHNNQTGQWRTQSNNRNIPEGIGDSIEAAAADSVSKYSAKLDEEMGLNALKEVRDE